MRQQADATTQSKDFFSAPTHGETFGAIADPEGPEGRAVLALIAKKIGETRKPGAVSDIPAGATYLAQFAVHDLDFVTREGTTEESLLDLALIYGDGPRHDAFCYQVPTEPGTSRYLLRIGRTRPTATSPAWGAARDLPRGSCPHLDAKGVETKSEVLVPNSFSDNNALLAQMQTLWALSHNAIAGLLAESRDPREAFEQARLINRGIYRDAIRNDVLGTWLMDKLRKRYMNARPRPKSGRRRAPREFMAGVGRLGHGMVREIYALNDQMPVVGLRNVMRHTSSGRPGAMPLTEDWLVDFSRFFAIGSSVPQKTRALGPHVARPIATGAGLAAGDPAADSIVLRDLLACTRGGLCSVRTLIARARDSDAHVFDGCFAQDEARWTRVLRAWLTDAGVDGKAAAALAEDPPLTLFLMLEAEADTEGKTLGALGSVLMGETLTAALPEEIADPAVGMARDLVFQGATPTTMAELIAFLQRHCNFADGARLHPGETYGATRAGKRSMPQGVTQMLDSNARNRETTMLIEVADYIEMGRQVVQWSLEEESRPKTVEALARQLDGIASVPRHFEKIEFVQSDGKTLYLRLPSAEILTESLEQMDDPVHHRRYDMPYFYTDYYNPGFGPVMSGLDTLLARIGDYTIAQCR